MSNLLMALMILPLVGASAQAEDRGFRYRGGTCVNATGAAGYNPGHVGPCGDLSAYAEREDFRKNRSFEGALLNGVLLGRAPLQEMNFRGAELISAGLRAARMQGADFRQTELSWADLRWARAQGADFRGANLHGADLGYARLEGADFRGADLSGARTRGDRHWHGARWDRFTVLPTDWGTTQEGRELEARRRGMTFVETTLDPNVLVRSIYGNPWKPCNRAAAVPADAEEWDKENPGYGGLLGRVPRAEQYFEPRSFLGSWEGEWEGVPGRLTIEPSGQGKVKGRFVAFEEAILRVSFEGRVSEFGSFGRNGNRVLFDWDDGRGARGNGSLLISKDGDSLTDMDALGFVRVEP